MSMVAEKWKPVFGNDHAQTNNGAAMNQIIRDER
jgi:hypothetical protein